MLSYLIRRFLYMVPILLGVMVLTFLLFNVMNKPLLMAQRILGPKANAQVIGDWLHNRGYDKPLFVNAHAEWSRTPPFLKITLGERPWDSQFLHTLKNFATFDLGLSDATGEPVSAMIRRGIGPSLCITLPAFVVGLALALSAALLMVFVRESLLDRWGVVLCVAAMSVPMTVYVIFGQWATANLLNWFPAFGFNMQGLGTAKFVALPVVIMVIGALGAEVRLYRAIFLEEIRADYIRTAEAKGAGQARVLFLHVLKNGMIAVITLVVASLPFLIMGTLIVENFFGIPGLGNLLVNAIQTSDFALVKASVYFGSVLYLIGLLLTDICYAAVDPRIRLQ